MSYGVGGDNTKQQGYKAGQVPSRHQFGVFPGNISRGDNSGVLLGSPRVLLLICFLNSCSQSQSGGIPGSTRDLCVESVARSENVLLAAPDFILHIRLTGVTAGQNIWKGQ